MEIAFDMDGVLVDFVQYFIDRYGVGPASATSKMWDDFWTTAVTQDHAFKNMKLMPQALDMWNYARSLGLPVKILTAASFNANPNSVMQKYHWCAANLPGFTSEMFNYVDRSEDKVKFLRDNPDVVLIDDMLDNVRAWIDASGFAIHHTHASATINELRSRFSK